MAVEKEQPQMENRFRFSPHPNRAHLINWHTWGPEAFEHSRREQKLILLSLSAVWCHWCHVMDETTFSHEKIIPFINENFIPVRVDSDQRPDINSRYNQGGWPTLALLTADGDVITGTTYMPPAEAIQFLTDVARLYRESASEIEATIEQLRKQHLEEPVVPGGELDQSITAHVLELAGDTYDGEFGGFGGETKFPYPNLMSLILANLADAFIEQLEKMLTASLDAMAEGGIYDHVEGGFFRYSTTRDWSVPHFEKMLEENAALLAVYADAYWLTGKESYASVAREVYHYLSSTLWDPAWGAFAGSQDADEEYYHLPAVARKEGEAPFVDPVVYSGWNALAASSLLRSFQVLGDPGPRESALQALDFVWNRMWDKQKGLYHYFDGSPHLPGLLMDSGRLVAACLDAYESGGGEHWLDRSLEVGRWLLANLQDPVTGAFFDCQAAPGQAGFGAERSWPLVDNSIAAGALIRLAQNTGQPQFGEAARRALEYFTGVYQQFGTFAADYALAVQRLLDPPVRVTIVGPPQEEPTTEMIRAAHLARIPFRSIEVLDPEVHAEELDATGYGYEGSPIAYICIASSCQPPVFDPADLPSRLEQGRHR